MTDGMIELTQRWRDRRERRIPSNGAVDKRDWAVDQISYSSAKAFVVANHYSGSMTTCIAAFGIFHAPQGGVRPAALSGVVVFGVPINGASIPKYAGADPAQGAEITRLVLDHEVPGNAESLLVSRAADALRTSGRVSSIITFADPLERRLQDGTVVKRGHFGGIYQALSMTYQGRTTPRWLWMDSRGCVVSERSLQKIRAEERGADYATRDFLASGAPPRARGETPSDWVARALREGPFTRLRHPGNHAYAWGLDRRARKAVATAAGGIGRGAYPKPDRLPLAA